MEEAIAFIRNFITKEYEALQVCYLERDEEVFEEKRNVVDRMYGSGLMTIVNRAPEPEEDWFTEGETSLKAVKERILFQIKAYDHPEYGNLYACYVSDPIGWQVIKDGIRTPQWSDSCDFIFYLAKVQSRLTGEMSLRIIANYNCDSNRYVYGSKPVEPFGTLLETKQFKDL